MEAMTSVAVRVGMVVAHLVTRLTNMVFEKQTNPVDKKQFLKERAAYFAQENIIDTQKSAFSPPKEIGIDFDELSKKMTEAETIYKGDVSSGDRESALVSIDRLTEEIISHYENTASEYRVFISDFVKRNAFWVSTALDEYLKRINLLVREGDQNALHCGLVMVLILDGVWSSGRQNRALEDLYASAVQANIDSKPEFMAVAQLVGSSPTQQKPIQTTLIKFTHRRIVTPTTLEEDEANHKDFMAKMEAKRQVKHEELIQQLIAFSEQLGMDFVDLNNRMVEIEESFLKGTPIRDADINLLAEICELYQWAIPEQQALIRDLIQRKSFWKWDAIRAYTRKMSEQVRATGNTQALRYGLLAVSIENGSTDYRDTLSILAELYRSAKAGRVNPNSEFAAVAALSSTEKVPGYWASMQEILTNFADKHGSGVL